MRHRVATRHLSRTSAHRRAMRRNMAQSLFQYGQIETTLTKAKDIRPFVERLITLARTKSLQNRRRVAALLGDRSVIEQDQQESYDEMTSVQRRKALANRSGRRFRTGEVPAHYNKKKIPFVARSIVYKLFEEVAPRYANRPGGYTRIIRLAKRRIGDDSDLAVLQLVGTEEATSGGSRSRAVSRRREKVNNRIRALEGKPSGSRGRGGRSRGASTSTRAESSTASPGESAGAEE